MSIYLTKRWRFHLPGTEALRQGLLSLSFLERVFMFVLFALLIGSTLTMLVEIKNIFSVEVPSPGGTLSEGIVGTPRFINPVIARSDADKDLVALIYSGLMRQDASGALIPDLAESYTVSRDGLTYTFILRDDVSFHDGTQITATDVVYTVRQIQNPLNGSPLARAWDGVMVEAPDERTIIFRLGKAYTPFIYNTTVGILPYHRWNETNEETFAVHRLNSDPVGSGPFMVDSIKRDDAGIPTTYILHRFNAFALGAPYLESITVSMYGNQRELFEAYSKGIVDSFHDIDPSLASSIETTQSTVTELPLPRVFGAFFNQNKNPVFAERAVRAALSGVIERQGLVDSILYGYGTPLDGPLPPPFINSEHPTTALTLAQARAYLEDAGWTKNSDGIYEKEKVGTLSFTIATANTTELKRTAEAVERAWEGLGAQVTVEFFELGELHQNIIRPRNYDVLLFGQVVGVSGDVYPFWHSSQRNDPGLNIALYTNIDVDDMLATIRTTLDGRERTELYASLEEEIEADVPAAFLYAPHLLYILPEWLKGVASGPADEPSERFMNVYEWHAGTRNILTASPNLLLL